MIRLAKVNFDLIIEQLISNKSQKPNTGNLKKSKVLAVQVFCYLGILVLEL